MEMQEDAGNATIVQSTIDLGHNLGLEVVAEGVESEESYSTLARLGCDYAQGYFLSKPLSPDKMSIWLGVCSGVSDEHELDQWALKAPAPAPAPAIDVDGIEPDDVQ